MKALIFLMLLAPPSIQELHKPVSQFTLDHWVEMGAIEAELKSMNGRRLVILKELIKINEDVEEAYRRINISDKWGARVQVRLIRGRLERAVKISL